MGGGLGAVRVEIPAASAGMTEAEAEAEARVWVWCGCGGNGEGGVRRVEGGVGDLQWGLRRNTVVISATPVCNQRWGGPP